MKSLPDKDSETRKFPKDYLCDVIYILVGSDFKGWVRSEIDARNHKVTVEGNLNIAMDP